MAEMSEGDPLDVKIDWDLCMGSGNCMFWAPDTFDLSDDGHAVVTDPTASPRRRSASPPRAARSAPSRCGATARKLPLEDGA